MNNWLILRKTGQEKTAGFRAPRAQRQNQNHCETMESCLTFPQFLSTQDKAKNSLDSETQKRDNGNCYLTN
jgi:hypothetical protein